MQALAHVAGALADDTRLRILHDLLNGGAAVSELGERLRLLQPRVSTHLKVLLDAGLVSVETMGRQRMYRVDAPRIARVLTALQELAPSTAPLSPSSIQAKREVQRNTPLRQARTCYDHLAGVVGVQLLEELLQRNWLALTQGGSRPQYALTPAGIRALMKRGVDLDSAQAARRSFASQCPDWTERRPHLGGALGAAILRTLREAGIIRRKANSRAVTLLKPLNVWIDPPSSWKEKVGRSIQRNRTGKDAVSFFRKQ